MPWEGREGAAHPIRFHSLTGFLPSFFFLSVLSVIYLLFPQLLRCQPINVSTTFLFLGITA